MAVLGLVAVDLLRAHPFNDEGDGDTLSEVIRGVVPDTKFGHALFASTLALGASWFYVHITSKHPSRLVAVIPLEIDSSDLQCGEAWVLQA